MKKRITRWNLSIAIDDDANPNQVSQNLVVSGSCIPSVQDGKLPSYEIATQMGQLLRHIKETVSGGGERNMIIASFASAFPESSEKESNGPGAN